MTPKEKAKELYNKVYGQTPIRCTELEIEEDKRFAKQCALIAVDEILNVLPQIERIYWKDVKQEIEKL